MFIKHARMELQEVGYLKDLEATLRKDDIWAPSLAMTMSKVAALHPIARYMDDFIYTRQRAISSFEHHSHNDNYDAFREVELQKSYPSFINTGFYKDHKNWDKKFAYGINLDARYHPNHFIEVISAISRKMQPDSELVVNNVLAGVWNSTSMGANVELSICSHCGNKATREEDFCPHIRSMKGSKIDGKTVFEFNEGLTFFDDSIITTEAAEKEALITEIYTLEDLKAEAEKRPSIYEIIRTPHLDIKACTNCKSEVPICKGDGSCGACHKEVVAVSTDTEYATHSNSVVSNGDSVDMRTLPVASQEKEGETKMAAKFYKSAEEQPMKAGDKVPATQIDRGDYVRSKDPTAAAVAEAKSSSEGASETSVGKSDQVSQQERKDYPHKSAGKISLTQKLINFLKKSGIEDSMDMGEAISSDGTDGGISDLEEVKDKAREGVDEVSKALVTVDKEKTKVLAKLRRTRIASLRKRAEEDLATLQNAETQLVDEKQSLENVVLDIKKCQEGEGTGEGGEGCVGIDADELALDVAEVIEQARLVIKDLVGEPIPEDGEVDGATGEMPEAPKAEKGKMPEQFKHKESPAKEHEEEEFKPKEKEEEDKASKSSKESSMCRGFKRKAAGEQASGKHEGGNPQLMIDRGDYPRSKDPENSLKSDADTQETATRSDIERQRSTGFSAPTEQIKQRELKLASARFYLALRHSGDTHVVAASKVRHFAQSMTLKFAQLKKTAEGAEEFKQMIAEETAKLLVDDLLKGKTDAEGPGPKALAPKGEEGMEDEKLPSDSEADSQEMFGTPPVAVTSAHKPLRNVRAENIAAGESKGAPTSDETTGEGDIVSDDPADDSWDLFPEDKVADTARKANSEQEAALRQDLGGVYTTEAKVKKPVVQADSRKLADILELAQSEVNAGLIEESALEQESKRLFLMAPSELKATAAIVDRARQKEAFKHPDSDNPDILKQAISMGEANGTDIENNLFVD